MSIDLLTQGLISTAAVNYNQAITLDRGVLQAGTYSLLARTPDSTVAGSLTNGAYQCHNFKIPHKFKLSNLSLISSSNHTGVHVYNIWFFNSNPLTEAPDQQIFHTDITINSASATVFNGTVYKRTGASSREVINLSDISFEANRLYWVVFYVSTVTAVNSLTCVSGDAVWEVSRGSIGFRSNAYRINAATPDYYINSLSIINPIVSNVPMLFGTIVV